MNVALDAFAVSVGRVDSENATRLLLNLVSFSRAWDS